MCQKETILSALSSVIVRYHKFYIFEKFSGLEITIFANVNMNYSYSDNVVK